MSRSYEIRLNLLLPVLLSCMNVFTQSAGLWISREETENRKFYTLSENLAPKYHIRFIYNSDSVPDIPVRMESDSMVLLDLLRTNFTTHGISVNCDRAGNYYLVRGNAIQTILPASVYSYAKRSVNDVIYKEGMEDFIITRQEYVQDTLIIGNPASGNGRQRYSFSGTVRDARSGEAVIGATLYIEELRTGVVTSPAGTFNMDLPRGEYTLVVSSLDKIPHHYNLYFYSSGSSKLLLEPMLYALDEVVVRAGMNDRVKSTQMGIERLTAKEIREIPLVLGERDVLKVAQYLPGIQKTGEASAGFNVRGSPSDQNIFYLNNIPIYNINHLVGFFSSIYPEAVSEFSIYKSNLPVEYGGRLSSIFDIELKKASREKFGMRGSISPVSSGILFEHPIVKNNGSFMLGGRSTYSDWLLDLVQYPQVRNSSVYFGDLLATAEYQISKKDQMEFTGYYSYDRINYNGQIDHNYENKGAALRWKHLIADRHTLQSNLVYSHYGYHAINREIVFDLYRHSYFINHYQWKNSILLHLHPDHSIIAGIDNTLYYQSRGKHYLLEGDRVLESTNLGTEQALETGLFAGDEWKLTQKLSLYGGIRYNVYCYLGPQTSYSYNSNEYLVENITDTIEYTTGQIIKSYQKPDIRLAFKYLIHPLISVKLSYNQLQQNIFMMSNSLSVSPTDKWKLADKYLQPLTGAQYSLGIYLNSPYRKWEFACEGYYKEVAHLVEYKDGANLLIMEIPETELLQGDLKVYGFEFMVERNVGKLTGWLNYTWTMTQVQVDGESPLKQVNKGLPYPANYEKPHVFNLISNYRFSKRLSLSWNLVYSTGQPYTSPISVYFLNGKPVINYSARNEKRIPDYFRIDLSLNLEGNLRKKKFAHGSWMFSVYNLTGRKNAYSVYFTEENNQIRAYQLSIFGTSIYTVTYLFKLGNYND